MNPEEKKIHMIENYFSYHAPTPDKLKKYENIRNAAKEFAYVLNKELEGKAPGNKAIQRLREVVMIANAMIACDDTDFF